jgi:hypothetical protein
MLSAYKAIVYPATGWDDWWMINSHETWIEA